jgi:hypothetical protein
VRDTTPPVVTTSGNQTVPATSPGGAQVTFTASATDLVDGSVTATCAPASPSVFAIGVTTVACSATDAHHNSGSSTFTVTVLSPEQVTEILIAQAMALGFQQASNLLTNLLKSLDKNNTAAACSQLAAFISQVKAQSGKSLTVQEAASLIEAATAARGALTCG